MPGGSRGYLQLIEEVDAPAPGFNLDTGHLHTAGEIVSHAIERLGDRIVGTHLCDNSGTENLSLAPGRGTIDWDATRDALSVTGYNGSFDVEIRCEATSVHDEYRHAIAFVREFFAPDARRSTAAQAQEE